MLLTNDAPLDASKAPAGALDTLDTALDAPELF